MRHSSVLGIGTGLCPAQPRIRGGCPEIDGPTQIQSIPNYYRDCAGLESHCQGHCPRAKMNETTDIVCVDNANLGEIRSHRLFDLSSGSTQTSRTDCGENAMNVLLSPQNLSDVRGHFFSSAPSVAVKTVITTQLVVSPLRVHSRRTRETTQNRQQQRRRP